MADRNVRPDAQRRSTRRQTYSNYDYELHGNAVRRTFVPDELPEELPEKKKITREDIERHQKAVNERAFDLKSFILVTCALAFVCFALFVYLGERGELHSHTKTVKNLTQELNEKTVLNDNRLTAIEAGIDYTALFNRAISELNMKFPSKDQVVWFHPTESEYISQYEEIPRNN